MMKPKLRFKEFSDEWEEKKLGEIAEFLDNKRKPLKEKDRNSGKYPYYGASGIIDYIDDYIFDKDLVLLSEDGANITDRNYRVSFIATGKYWVNNHAHVLEPKINIDLYVLSESLERLNYEKYNTGTAQPKLNKEICKNIKLYLPSLPEQTKIGEFLSLIDKKIELEEKALYKINELKKGYMQKIFNQEIRFKDENRNDYPEWEDIKLADMLLDKIDNRGKTPPNNLIRDNYPLLEVNSIGKFNVNYSVVTKYISEDIYNNWFRKHIKKGDILYSTVGNTAICSYYNGIKKSCIAQNLVGFRFKETHDSKFMYYMFSEIKNYRKMKSIEMIAVQPSIKVSQLIKLKFNIPSLPEQTKIANFLSKQDELIEKQEAKIALLKEQKKGLLQQMFV